MVALALNYDGPDGQVLNLLDTNMGSVRVICVPGAAGGVTSFNGRTGAVVPVAGDYQIDPTALAQFLNAPAANTFLKGNGVGVAASWAALLSTPANPGDDGKLWLAQSGDAAFDAAYAPNLAAPTFRLGTAPGTGAGAGASTGHLRVNKAFTAFARNDTDASDVQLLSWVSASSNWIIGSNNTVTTIQSGAAGTRFNIGGTDLMSLTTTTGLGFLAIGTLQWANGNTASLQYQVSNAATNPFNIRGQDASATTTAVAGNISAIAGNGTAAGAISVSQTAGTSFMQGGQAQGASGTRVQGKAQLRDPGGVPVISATYASVGAASQLGFFNATEATKQTPTGSRGGNAALASLLTALATYGLITDGTSA